MSEKDLEFFENRGFGKKLGFGTCLCLIVVDFINGFTDENMPMGSNLDKEIKNTNELIKVARLQSIPVIFTTISYSNSYLDSRNIWRNKMEGLNTLQEGTRAVLVDERLDYQPQDDLLVKKYASSFFGTDLVSLLNNAKVDTLLITGCTTSGCVKSTVVDAVQHGFCPIVVKDAVGDRSKASHTQSLFDIEQKYADVMTTSEIIGTLIDSVNSPAKNS
ncbi:isochorismatase family protein [Halalkalibacter oceani]|uniref:Isochorismatase family protein n=1 Tax=Halalkalibacter oceani TaxID=1653776 RepID=A0A9X2DTR8_9BACI|nr:isochorismatase family protein [Halalkalibacter oceani]MCM3715375.1 isochorismatase family protein [Halalkalibacter oceani]